MFESQNCVTKSRLDPTIRWARIDTIHFVFYLCLVMYLCMFNCSLPFFSVHCHFNHTLWRWKWSEQHIPSQNIFKKKKSENNCAAEHLSMRCLFRQAHYVCVSKSICDGWIHHEQVSLDTFQIICHFLTSPYILKKYAAQDNANWITHFTDAHFRFRNSRYSAPLFIWWSSLLLPRHDR